jgi:hypothetical protein
VGHGDSHRHRSADEKEAGVQRQNRMTTPSRFTQAAPRDGRSAEGRFFLHP